MTDIAFQSLLSKIQNGGEPCTVGQTFTPEQVILVKTEISKRGEEWNAYFNLCIAPRLAK